MEAIYERRTRKQLFINLFKIIFFVLYKMTIAESTNFTQLNFNEINNQLTKAFVDIKPILDQFTLDEAIEAQLNPISNMEFCRKLCQITKTKLVKNEFDFMLNKDYNKHDCSKMLVMFAKKCNLYGKLNILFDISKIKLIKMSKFRLSKENQQLLIKYCILNAI